MGNSNEKPDFKELSKGTKFSAKELKDFFKKFKSSFPDGKMNKIDFEKLYKEMFGTTGDATEFCNLVFDQYDQDHSGVINFKEFIMTLSVASRGTIDEKLLWAFDLYDRDNNGYLSEEEIVHVLTAVYKAKNRPNPYGSAQEVARNIVKNSDDNKDGRISQAEFIHHAKSSKDIKELLTTL